MKIYLNENQFNLMLENVKIENVKLPDFILNSIKSKKTSIGDNPALPPEKDIRFEEKILKNRYFEVLNSVKKIEELNNDISKGNLIKHISILRNKIKEIEQEHKSELEDICREHVMNIFEVKNEDINFKCKLNDNIIVKQSITPKEVSDDFYNDVEHIKLFESEVLKRRFINSIIQGSCVRLSSNYENIFTKLFYINKKLPELYVDLINVNEYLSFIKEQKPNVDNIVGTVNVDLSSEIPSISSEAENFPTLVFESIKGFMELLSSNGLPDDRYTAINVLKQSDFLLAENWDRRLGVGIWDIICDNMGHGNMNIMPYIFTELISLPVKEFNNSMNEILSNTKKGKSIISDIVSNIKYNLEMNEISSEINSDSENEYFEPDELITETDTTSVGEIQYDVPAFGDDDTLNHKNLIQKSIKDGL